MLLCTWVGIVKMLLKYKLLAYSFLSEKVCLVNLLNVHKTFIRCLLRWFRCYEIVFVWRNKKNHNHIGLLKINVILLYHIDPSFLKELAINEQIQLEIQSTRIKKKVLESMNAKYSFT